MLGITGLFAKKANDSIERYLQIDGAHVHRIRDFMVIDEANDSYPYLTVLLLYRAGLHAEAIWFCRQQASLVDVQDFGEHIYEKYFNSYNCCLPQGEITQFMTRAREVQGQGHHDVCREALVHLMIGCDFKYEDSEVLFDFLLDGDYDNWLWFQLKLASFQYSTRSSS